MRLSRAYLFVSQFLPVDVRINIRILFVGKGRQSCRTSCYLFAQWCSLLKLERIRKAQSALHRRMCRRMLVNSDDSLDRTVEGLETYSRRTIRFAKMKITISKKLIARKETNYIERY